MGRKIMALSLALALAGCSQQAGSLLGGPESGEAAEGAAETRVAASAPPASATTVDQFDTTTEAQKAAAAAPLPVAEVRLGTTVASLGDPSDPGFWAETGLVDAVAQGRLEYPEAGTSVQVELRPSGGSPGSGTRVSLPAMRVLEAPLTALPTLVVYSE